ncbi:MAG: ATP:cob(I)alamin adenosyltransferase [Nitrosomonadales bacterium]|nr:ATP:cob(I)alamin adenosyltransferase [Nitrosomonadales bacterium]
MKIYTKKGDKGKTSLLFGKKVYKNDIAPEAYGSVDELVAALGLVRYEEKLPIATKDLILRIQRDLFIVGAELATDSENSRRAERRCVTWKDMTKVENSFVGVYLNRLSDLLWMLARDFEEEWTASK